MRRDAYVAAVSSLAAVTVVGIAWAMLSLEQAEAGFVLSVWSFVGLCFAFAALCIDRLRR